MIQVDGFEAKVDLKDKTTDELAHMAIDAIIHLAHNAGTTIESVLVDLLESHRAVKGLLS